MVTDIAGQTKLDIIKNTVTATQMRLAYRHNKNGSDENLKPFGA